MKKIVLILSFILVFTGCGTKEKELQLHKINNGLNELVINQLDYTNLIQIVEEELDTVNVYETQDIVDKIGLNPNTYQNIFFCTSNEELQYYLIIQPETNQKESVKEIINQFFETAIVNTEKEEEKQKYINRLEQSYGDNLIYLVGTQLTEKLEKIKDTKKNIFPNMITLEQTDLETDIHLNMDNIESYMCAVTDKLNRVEQYIILKYKKEEETSVRKSMHDYFEQLENEWKEKDSKNYQIIKNRMEQQLGDYLIYLVSEDNQLAFETIEQYYK